eukprot:m.241290 g.241290  ORF g.241290 m.241290 type:complete len:91 (-) comp16086_c0_seq37:1651-1923(-)
MYFNPIGLKVLMRGLVARVKKHKFSHVTPEMMEFIEVYVSLPDYTETAARHALPAIEGLQQWTYAIVEMYKSTVDDEFAGKLLVPVNPNM